VFTRPSQLVFHPEQELSLFHHYGLPMRDYLLHFLARLLDALLDSLFDLGLGVRLLSLELTIELVELFDLIIALFSEPFEFLA